MDLFSLDGSEVVQCNSSLLCIAQCIVLEDVFYVAFTNKRFILFDSSVLCWNEFNTTNPTISTKDLYFKMFKPLFDNTA